MNSAPRNQYRHNQYWWALAAVWFRRERLHWPRWVCHRHLWGTVAGFWCEIPALYSELLLQIELLSGFLCTTCKFQGVTICIQYADEAHPRFSKKMCWCTTCCWHILLLLWFLWVTASQKIQSRSAMSKASSNSMAKHAALTSTSFGRKWGMFLASCQGQVSRANYSNFGWIRHVSLTVLLFVPIQCLCLKSLQPRFRLNAVNNYHYCNYPHQNNHLNQHTWPKKHSSSSFEKPRETECRGFEKCEKDCIGLVIWWVRGKAIECWTPPLCGVARLRHWKFGADVTYPICLCSASQRLEWLEQLEIQRVEPGSKAIFGWLRMIKAWHRQSENWQPTIHFVCGTSCPLPLVLQTSPS